MTAGFVREGVAEAYREGEGEGIEEGEEESYKREG